MKWKCCICNNIFFFNNDDQRLVFMINHANTCCKVIYPNGVTAYVGPSTRYITDITARLSSTSSQENIQDGAYNISTTLHDVNADSRPWITIPEKIGYATAKLLLILRDMYNIVLEEELLSLRYIDREALMTELDREKAVKIYCTRKCLVDTVKRIVLIDDFLYSILIDDEQITNTIDHMISDRGSKCYYIHTNSRNMYARQIACALRRLDKASTLYDNKLLYA